MKDEYEPYFLKAVELYKELHRVPETGFDLDETVKIVKRELKEADIPYTEKYGQASVVAEIGSGERVLAFRADMDALPIEEKTDLPYASKFFGRMHACGHDSHTAILLCAAKYLKVHEDELNCRVRFIFQPSEECVVSGAEMMVKNGVMDGVDRIICTHCENTLESGKIAVCEGDYMAACVPLRIKFFGKSAHATLPKEGINAIAMAVAAYTRFEKAVAALAGELRYIWSVGKFAGGTAHNVISDFCEMDISFRFYNMDFSNRVKDAVFEICKDVEQVFGGRIEIDWNMSTGPVHNDKTVVEGFIATVSDSGIEIVKAEQRMSSEDFGWYLTRAKGLLFRYGTRNEAKGCTALAHCSDFKIDENGMKTALQAFVSYAVNFK